jgi:hypothetical protein
MQTIPRINLSAFKDGVADGLLKGNRAAQHPDIYYYKQGYDFGLALYNRLNDYEEISTYEEEKERYEGGMFAQKTIILDNKKVNFEIFAQVMSDGLAIEYTLFLDKQEHDGGFYDMPNMESIRWDSNLDQTAQNVFDEIIDGELNFLLKRANHA